MESVKKLVTKTESDKVIDFDDGNLLVSASAGSGKTYCMVGRLVRLIKEGKVSVDSVLCVTFTEKAAAEMKERINKKLIETIEKGNCDVDNLKKQLLLIPSADICTIDAFCLRLVKSYFYKVGVPQDFSILSEDNAELMQAEILDDLFEEYYTNNDSDFIYLIKRFVKGRKDNNLKEIILKLYKKFCNSEDFDKYIKLTEEFANDSWFENIYNEKLKDLTKNFDSNKAILEDLIKFYGDGLKTVKAGTSIQNALDLCNNMYDVIVKVQKDGIENSISEIAKINTKNGKPKCIYMPNIEEKNKNYFAIRNEILELKNFTKKYLVKQEATQLAEWPENKRIVDHLVNIVKEFRARFSAEKLKQGYLDFNDIERYAYMILNPKDNDTGVVDTVKEQYKFIFVDEYQDVNGLQEAIITSISNNNLFCVGDAKQSIYGFRGCDCSIFERREKYFTDPSCNAGNVMYLSKNYRSAKNILSFVNEVFHCVAGLNLGMKYDETAELKLSDKYPTDYEGKVSYISVKTKEDATKCKGIPTIDGIYDILGGNTTTKQIDYSEENAVADKIEDYIKNKIKFYDLEEQKEREVRLSDIAILLRGTSGASAKKLIKTLTNRSIPVTGVVKDDLLKYNEVIVVKSLVELLDNFKQDIPLAICLKALWGITDDQLAEIKLYNNHSHFYSSFYDYIKGEVAPVDKDLQDKLKAFLDCIKTERERSKYLTIDKVLEEILNLVNYKERLMLSSLGAIKVAHVDTFIALSCSSGSGMYLPEFIKLLSNKNLEKTGCLSNNDGVKLMTMHKSKGLEFPVVILPYLDESFNRGAKDNSDVIISDNYGIIAKNYNVDSYEKSNNIVMCQASEEEKRNKILDELRLFYVALTRAKYYLDIFVKKDKFEKSDSEESNYNSYVKFIDKHAEPIVYSKELYGKSETKEFPFENGDDSIKQAINSNINFVYEHQASLQMPMKASVTSSLKHDEEDKSKHIFVDNESSIEAGLIAHKIMECIDFNKDFDEEYSRLCRENIINEEDVKKYKVDINSIKNVLTFPIFKEISGHTLWKEKQFIAKIDAHELYENIKSGGDSLMLQGIIDLLAIKDNKAIIIDYKYSGRSEDDIKNYYKKQLDLYAYAVEKVLKIKVEKRYIVNLKLGGCFEI